MSHAATFVECSAPCKANRRAARVKISLRKTPPLR
jgi:hypothetical protein